jgi:hypothetical protein
VLEDVLAAVACCNGNYDDLLDNLAPLRSRLHRHSGQMERNERVALCTTITSHNSIESVERFLARYNWDIVVALEAWVRRGGVPLLFPAFRGRGGSTRLPSPRSFGGSSSGGYGNGQTPNQIKKDKAQDAIAARKHREQSGLRDINVNQPSHPLFGTWRTFTDDIQAYDRHRNRLNPLPLTLPLNYFHLISTRTQRLQIKFFNRLRYANRITRLLMPDFGTREYVKKETRKAIGTPVAVIISSDRWPAVIHCSDPTKLYFETLRNGNYKITRSTSQVKVNNKMRDFRWENARYDTEQTGQVEFDWHNKEHIKRLNTWRNNLLCEWSGLIKREGGEPVNKCKEQWLAEKKAKRLAHWWEIIANDHGAAVADQIMRDVGNFPMDMADIEALHLTQEFNQTFAKKRIYMKHIYRFPDRKPVVQGTTTTFPKDCFKIAKKETVRKDMRAVSKKIPRPERTVGAIRQHPSRLINYVKNYLMECSHENMKAMGHPSQLPYDSD